jgi:hypothetical protein
MFKRLFLQSPQSLPLALAATAAIVLAVIWLYRSQLRMLPTPWNWLVPALRMAAVAVLIAALAKPVIVRLRNPWEQGAVVLLIDRSRSMSVMDSHRSISQRVALADALGLLPAGLRPIVSKGLRMRAEALGPLADAVTSARSELEYAQLSGRGVEAANARLHDSTAALLSSINTLRSEANAHGKSVRFVQACDEVLALFDPSFKRDWTSRLRVRIEAVATASGEFQSAADLELYQSNQIARAAADEIARQSRLALVDRALNDPTSGLMNHLPPQTPVLAFAAEPSLPSIALSNAATSQPVPDSPESDLNGAIAAARKKLGGQPIQAVVLFSDGRQVGGSSGAAPTLDVPLFTIGVAGLIRKDIAIARFDVPSAIFVGESANARVEIAALGVKDQQVDVTVTASGKPQTQHVILNDGRTTIAFPIKADAPGILHIMASLGGIPSDATAANNQSERRIKVLADRVAVTVIGGSAGWDFQYLRNALQRTPWVQCHDEIVRKDLTQLRMSPDEILKQQVVILDDVDPDALKPGQWKAIGTLVSELGGGVIVVAGDDVSPARMATQPVLADLLPWRSGQIPAWQTWAGEVPGYRLMPAAESTDAVKLSNDAQEDRHRWAQLPAMFRVLPIILAKPNVRPLLVESESNEPVLTEARMGVGRAIFLGADETWRWRNKIGERDQDRFWLQLIREAGEAPYAVHDQTMALDVDNISPHPDQPVQVRARILDQQGRPAGGISPAIRVEKDGSEVMTVPLRPAIPQVETGRYLVDLPGLPNGDYDIRLMLGAKATKLAASLHIEPNYEAEMADVSGDDANLRRLAEASGGAFLRLDQIGSLPDKLSAARENRPQTTEYPLWDSPYLFLFVLGCLGGEWAMRKQFGLV